MRNRQGGEQHRIVVGVDGFESSKAALRWAIRQAELTGAVVEAVIAWHVPVGTGWIPTADMPDYQEDALTVLRAGDPLADAGHDAHALVPRDERDRRGDRPVAVGGMDVGMAQAGCLHPDDDLAGSGHGYRPVLDDQRLAEARHYCCSHLLSLQRLTRHRAAPLTIRLADGRR